MGERPPVDEPFWYREYRDKARSGHDLVAAGRGERFGTADYLRIVAHVIGTLRPRVTDRVFDIGCGNGLMAIALAPLCREVVGVEPVRELAELARRNNRASGNVHIISGESMALPVQSASADVVLCYGVLQYLEQPDDAGRTLSDIARALRRPGRALVGSIPDLRKKDRVLEPYLAGVRAASHLSADQKAVILERNRRARWFDPEALAGVARRAGLTATWRAVPDGLLESEDRFELLLERGDR